MLGRRYNENRMMRQSKSTEVGFSEDASERTPDQRRMDGEEPASGDMQKSMLGSGDLRVKSLSRNKLDALKAQKEFPHGCGQ